MENSVEIDDRLLKAVEEFANNRGSDNQKDIPKYNAVYSVVTRDFKKVVPCNYHTCFGALSFRGSYYDLNDDTKKGAEAVLSQIQYNAFNNDRQAYAKEFSLYYEWLMNFSPYRDAFLVKDKSLVLDKGVVVLNAKVHNAVMLGGGILSRHPYEAYSANTAKLSSLVRLWTKLVEKGMNPNYAFALVMSLDTNKDGDYFSGAGEWGHGALATCYTYAGKNFIADRKRKVDLSSYSLSKDGLTGTDCSPSHLFNWGSGEKPLDNFNNWVKDQIRGACLKSEKAVNIFGDVIEVSSLKSDGIFSHFYGLEKEVMEFAHA